MIDWFGAKPAKAAKIREPQMPALQRKPKQQKHKGVVPPHLKVLDLYLDYIPSKAETKSRAEVIGIHVAHVSDLLDFAKLCILHLKMPPEWNLFDQNTGGSVLQHPHTFITGGTPT